MNKLSKEDQKILGDIVQEGFIRRLASGIVGRFSREGLKNTSKIHEFSKSVAYDVGKDISKTFGGEESQHVKMVYNIISDYLKSISNNTK
jgi:hypothetical protein